MLKRVTNCFIDLRKAFDTVWHDELFLKLPEAGILGKIYRVIKSIHHSSQAEVKCHQLMSDTLTLQKESIKGMFKALFYLTFSEMI